ncbi:hypothetical protein AX769_10355 [Frondihabitans sp. PAMC 28766]|uniref:hypothetical protein n=1 Tax=Frondihabitans sp. PAMC 28766 TaxID=1795630 RepID=UPI00078C265A|nr:hypothetical protein [Frondihabitans sp. PAMC 28766]AMM20475.1 hypothetical protein AX769_10355 [Frondihabitans sp. PAMC 28766]
MRKITKIATASALVLGAMFVAPAAANAAGYVPSSNVTVSGAVVAGGTDTVGFASGSFDPGENVTFSVTGAGRVQLAALAQQTVTLTKAATSTGADSVSVTLPAGASGTYTLTATGATSGNVATAALSVVPADGTAASTSGALAFTGSTVSMLVVWSAAGAVALGIAFMIVLALVRRQRTNLL